MDFNPQELHFSIFSLNSLSLTHFSKNQFFKMYEADGKIVIICSEVT